MEVKLFFVCCRKNRDVKYSGNERDNDIHAVSYFYLCDDGDVVDDDDEYQL